MDGLVGFVAAFLIAGVTAPVGVSGAVFLLPVQLDVLRVPSPAVTPTNLLFNVVATPGALLRYGRRAPLRSPLTRRLLAGTLLGVVVGAVLRVHVVAGDGVFRLCAAGLLLPLGGWLCVRDRRPRRRDLRLGPAGVRLLAFAVGVAGGVYGIGGGSILGPVLVGAGLPLATVAPAALTTTWLTSIVGALAYGVLAVSADGSVAPDWTLGLLCGLGGLLGGFAGASVQPRIPERVLTTVLGLLAMAVGLVYVGGVLFST